jgi:hypothetical protein
MPFLLGDASEDAENLPVPVILLELLQAIEYLLLRFIPDAAGVVQHQVRLFRRLHLRVALGNERSNDLFGIVNVHLAAERFDVEGSHA